LAGPLSGSFIKHNQHPCAEATIFRVALAEPPARQLADPASTPASAPTQVRDAVETFATVHKGWFILAALPASPNGAWNVEQMDMPGKGFQIF
jgi:hypothetical protein